MSAERLLWGEGQPLPDGGPFDFVLASDCTYHEQTRAPLAFTLRQLLLEPEPPRVVVSQQRRDGAAAIDFFLEVATSYGLAVASTVEVEEPTDSDENKTIGVSILELSIDGDVTPEAAAGGAKSDPRFVF